jgi:hypothetical protein
MKYEEWIQYERARLEEQKRRVAERLQREEEQGNQSDRDAEGETKPKHRGPIPPNPPPMTA